MIQILPVADIYKEEIVIDDNFGQRQEGWETVESDTESAFFRMGRYIMENKTDDTWNYYHKELPNNLGDNFIIKAELVLSVIIVFKSIGLVICFLITIQVVKSSFFLF